MSNTYQLSKFPQKLCGAAQQETIHKHLIKKILSFFFPLRFFKYIFLKYMDELSVLFISVLILDKFIYFHKKINPKALFLVIFILNISLTPYLRKTMITCRLVRQDKFAEGSAFARMFNTQLSKFPRKLCRAGWSELPMHVPPICERTRHPGRAESIFGKGACNIDHS